MNRTLIGRDDVEAAIRHALEAGERLVTVKGPPGVGKTALSRVVASKRAALGTWVVTVRLEGARTRAAMLERIDGAVGLSNRSSDARVLFERFVDAVDARRLTLVLDGLDAERESVAALVGDLLEATEGLAVVACAWTALGLPLERVFPLEPLPPNAAWELLERRVYRLAPQRGLSRKDGEVLLQRAGGLPLAIELVAARVAALGVAPVLADVSAHGVVGEGLDQALRAAWDVLNDEGRHALTALSVFRGSFDAEAALAVIGPSATLDVLQRLFDASLLQLDDSLDPPYRLLDSIRDFAARQLGDDAAHAHARHAAFFARPLPARLDTTATWPRMVALREDLLAAWEWALEHRPALSVQLAVTLDPLLVTKGSVALHRRVLAETLERGGASGSSRIDVLLSLGRVDAIRGRFRASLAPLHEALALAEALGDQTRVGWACSFLCFTLRPLGQLDECLRHGERALDLAWKAQDHQLAGMSQQALGKAAFAAGDLELAKARQRQAGASARLANAPRLLAITLTNLGEVLTHERSFDEAAEALALARVKFTETGDAFHLARLSVHELRHAVSATGSVDGKALQRALDQVIGFGDLEGELDCRRCMVQAAIAHGDVLLARQRLDELIAVTRFTDDVHAKVRVSELERLVDVTTVLGAPKPLLELSKDGRTMVMGAKRFDLSRRGPLKRIVIRLVTERVERPGRALTAAEVQAAGWPGEKMFPESAAARVYMAIRRLRELGLEPLLLTTDAGYHLSESADVRWLP